MPGTDLCDDGAGRTPRFITVEACMAEAGITVPRGRSYAVTGGGHPALRRCAPGVFLYTYAEARNAQVL